MNRDKAQMRQLKAIIDRADALSKVATREWRSTILDIRKEVKYMTSQLNLGMSSVNREKVIQKVQWHISRLRRRLERLENAQMNYVAKDATRTVSRMTGLQVEYSKQRADAILALIRERSGGSMAATFTRAMSKTAITALRNAVVGAFMEQAVSGGTQRELADSIRDRWNAVVGNEKNFRFVDRSGRTWDTNQYIQMNVRANSMQLYNKQCVDRIVTATGSDLVQVSDDGRTKESCKACQKWAGRILSANGADKDFPTLAEAEDDGLFHPNCIHTLGAVVEGWDDAEIERQRIENRKAKKKREKKGGAK